MAATTATAVSAQTTERAARWQIAIVGGMALFELPTSGEAALPPPGPTLTTSSPINPSRRVPTWFLSDGASLLNGANVEFGVPAQLAPLDGVLGGIGLRGSNAPAAGVRLSRYLSDRWAVEISGELHQGAAEIDPAILDAAEISRASFIGAFQGLFSTGPFSGVDVNATMTSSGATTRELFVSGALRFHILTGDISPYVTLGAGAISDIGGRPRVTLQGDYRFSFNGSPTFAESDTLTLRFDQQTSVLGVGGLGVTARLSERIGLMLDGRVLVGKPTYTLRLDSSPTVTPNTAPSAVESFTTPAVQFNGNPATGRLSTLSGDPLNGFEAFRSSDIQLRYVVTAGLAIRF